MSFEFTVGTMNRSIRYFGFVQMPDPPPPLRSNVRPPGHILVSNSHPRGHESWSNAKGLPGGLFKLRYDRCITTPEHLLYNVSSDSRAELICTNGRKLVTWHFLAGQ